MTAPEIRVTGIVSRDAESRAGSGDSWWVFLELHLGPNALPVAAAKRIGTGVPADLASKSMARQMRRGTVATVRAARFDILLLPTPHLQLINVQHIDYPSTIFSTRRAA